MGYNAPTEGSLSNENEGSYESCLGAFRSIKVSGARKVHDFTMGSGCPS